MEITIFAKKRAIDNETGKFFFKLLKLSEIKQFAGPAAQGVL